MGHDISPEENQYQAGLEFTISYKKILILLAKMLLKIKEQKISKQMMMFTLKQSKPGFPLLLMKNQFI